MFEIIMQTILGIYFIGIIITIVTIMIQEKIWESFYGEHWLSSIVFFSVMGIVAGLLWPFIAYLMIRGKLWPKPWSEFAQDMSSRIEDDNLLPLGLLMEDILLEIQKCIFRTQTFYEIPQSLNSAITQRNIDQLKAMGFSIDRNTGDKTIITWDKVALPKSAYWLG